MKILAVTKPGGWVRPAVATALLLTVSCTLLNLGLVFVLMANGFGLGLFSALAVAFGGYIAWDEWQLLQATATRSE